VILDGSNALHKAVRMMFGDAALVQRCQIHKLRNVLDHLPERQRPWVKAILQRAYRQDDVATAKRLLQDLARRLDGEYPSAAASVREGPGGDADQHRAPPVARAASLTEHHQRR
jgi:transposase-like protein